MGVNQQFILFSFIPLGLTYEWDNNILLSLYLNAFYDLRMSKIYNKSEKSRQKTSHFLLCFCDSFNFAWNELIYGWMGIEHKRMCWAPKMSNYTMKHVKYAKEEDKFKLILILHKTQHKKKIITGCGINFLSIWNVTKKIETKWMMI